MPYDEKQLRKHRDAMARGDAVAVVLETHEEDRAPGAIRLLRLSPGERQARGRKWLLRCLLFAPVTFLCPPHFPWPILTVVVGFVGSWLRGRQSELVAGGEASCPRCHAFQILDAGNAEFPMVHFCSECRARSLVRVTPASQQP